MSPKLGGQEALLLKSTGSSAKVEVVPEAPAENADLPESHELQPGELIVGVEYSCAQHLDAQLVSGRVQVELPCVMGFEGVGRVLRSGCDKFEVGSRVAFIMRRLGEDFGCWRKEVLLSDDYDRVRNDEEGITGAGGRPACVIELPRSLAPQEAAAGILSTVTALACLRHFTPGSLLVVPGACGGVGLALMQLAPLHRMKAVGLVRGARRVMWLATELNAVAVDVEADGWQALAAELCEVSEHHDVGAHGIVDGVGGEVLAQATQTLARAGGLVVRYGDAGGLADEEALKDAVKEYRMRVVHETASTFLSLADADAKLQAIFELMDRGKYRAHCWQLQSWRHATPCLVPLPSWNMQRGVSIFTPGRIGRIILKFD